MAVEFWVPLTFLQANALAILFLKTTPTVCNYRAWEGGAVVASFHTLLPRSSLGETGLKLQHSAQLGFLRSPAFTHDRIVAELSLEKPGSGHLLGRSLSCPLLGRGRADTGFFVSLLSDRVGAQVCHFNGNGTPARQHLRAPLPRARTVQLGIRDTQPPGSYSAGHTGDSEVGRKRGPFPGITVRDRKTP